MSAWGCFLCSSWLLPRWSTRSRLGCASSRVSGRSWTSEKRARPRRSSSSSWRASQVRAKRYLDRHRWESRDTLSIRGERYLEHRRWGSRDTSIITGERQGIPWSSQVRKSQEIPWASQVRGTLSIAGERYLDYHRWEIPWASQVRAKRYLDHQRFRSESQEVPWSSQVRKLDNMGYSLWMFFYFLWHYIIIYYWLVILVGISMWNQSCFRCQSR